MRQAVKAPEAKQRSNDNVSGRATCSQCGYPRVADKVRPPAEGGELSESANGTTTGPDDRTEILTVHGELDVATADILYRRGRTAIGRHTRLLLLDLASLAFCDAAGLNAIVRIANEAEAAGCRYGLIAPQPPVAKLLRITGLNKRLQVFATIDQACQHFTAPAATPPVHAGSLAPGGRPAGRCS